VTTAVHTASRPPRPTAHVRADRLIWRLAMAGAALGLLAGLLELTIGPSIRDWVGNKQDTTRLGLATIALSSVALAAAMVLRRAQGPVGGRRLALVLALVVPALICFTTVGRLWLVPGVLLMGAGGSLLVTGDRHDLLHALDERVWRKSLVALCGAYYVFLGASALGIAGLLGILGGLLVWTALATASHSRVLALTLLTIGALPFAIVTWWSVVTPIVAVLVLVLGRSAVSVRTERRRPPPASRSATSPRSSRAGAA